MRCGLAMSADRADRPVRGDPFAGGMRQHGGQIDQPGRGRGPWSARWRSRAGPASCARCRGRSRAAHSGSCAPPSPGRPLRIVAVSDFSGLTSSAWALAKAEASAATVSLDRGMGGLRRRTSKLTAPDFERLPRTPCPIASLASSGIKALSSVLARSWSRKAPGVPEQCRQTRPRNSTSSCRRCGWPRCGAAAARQ